MKKQDFVSEVLNFSDNKLYYRAVEFNGGNPGVRFVFKEFESSFFESLIGFTWRDYEIEGMSSMNAIDIGYCLSCTSAIVKWREQVCRK